MIGKAGEMRREKDNKRKGGEKGKQIRIRGNIMEDKGIKGIKKGGKEKMDSESVER